MKFSKPFWRLLSKKPIYGVLASLTLIILSLGYYEKAIVIKKINSLCNKNLCPQKNQFNSIQSVFYVNSKIGKNGNTYYEGDTVLIKYSVTNSGYVSIYSIDSTGIHVLRDFQNYPLFVKANNSDNKSPIQKFILDNYKGREIYFSILCNCPFEKSGSIESN